MADDDGSTARCRAALVLAGEMADAANGALALAQRAVMGAEDDPAREAEAIARRAVLDDLVEGARELIREVARPYAVTAENASSWVARLDDALRALIMALDEEEPA